MEKKIRRLSFVLRWAVALLGFGAATYVASSFFFKNEWVLNSQSPIFQLLWDEYPQLHVQLILSQIPNMLMGLGLTFWVWKLFGHYEQGKFFGDESQRCYLWLIWLYGLAIPVRILYSLWLPYFANMHTGSEEFHLTLHLDLSKIFTLFVLISIVYILRAAMVIEQENKEFI